MAVEIDGVANVVGRYPAAAPDARDSGRWARTTTRWCDAGNTMDGSGILTGLVVIEHLKRIGRGSPFTVELIAFSEEEGLRFSASYIGSAAVAGSFDRALAGAARPRRRFARPTPIAATGFDPGEISDARARAARISPDISRCTSSRDRCCCEERLPLRCRDARSPAAAVLVTVTGTPATPAPCRWRLRHDAAAAAAEIVLAVEQRCARRPTLVGTVGSSQVPRRRHQCHSGPLRAVARRSRRRRCHARCGRCRYAAPRSTRSPRARRHGRLAGKCSAAARSHARRACRRCSRDAIARVGVPPRYLPSGAGHDAMKFGGITETGMLFVRCGNGGVSHSPRETVTAEDADIAARVVARRLLQLAEAS